MGPEFRDKCVREGIAKQISILTKATKQEFVSVSGDYQRKKFDSYFHSSYDLLFGGNYERSEREKYHELFGMDELIE